MGNTSSEEVRGGPASPEAIQKITAEMTQQVGLVVLCRFHITKEGHKNVDSYLPPRNVFLRRRILSCM